MRGVLAAVALFVLLVPAARAGGPYMAVGAAEDVVEQPSLALAKAELAKATLAGLTTIRVTETWTRGQRQLTAQQADELGNLAGAATFDDVRVIVSLYPFGSSVTPLTQDERDDFTAFCVDVAKRFPTLHDFIVGNEPNLNRFWMPQFGPDGEDVAAPAYEQLLAQTYDALKAVRPHSTVYGGALAPRGVDKPNTGRDTHSPTAFIADLGAAYRASGRELPIMDAFAIHPYPENSSIGPDFPHPHSSAIGLADYDKLVGLLGQAFDGTAQRGSTLPILYDEFGIETQIPAAKASLYTGHEPATTKPVDEATQAADYREALAMAFCQKTVLGILFFHFQDEPALAAWQSGLYYADGSPKSSLGPVRTAIGELHRGVIAQCPGLQLTPKLTVKPAPERSLVRVAVTCDLDCDYTVTLDRRHPLKGVAVGGVSKAVLFGGAPAPGRHTVSVTAVATKNPGPPRTVRVTFGV